MTEPDPVLVRRISEALALEFNRYGASMAEHVFETTTPLPSYIVFAAWQPAG